MRHPGLFLGLLLTISSSSLATAESLRINMADPLRAVGREDDIRVDAQLHDDAVASGLPVAFSCQVENLSNAPIALSEISAASYDAESRVVTVSVGSEVPAGGNMPRMTIIPSGGKKIFTAAPMLQVAIASGNRLAPTPRYVQIVVHVLRNLAPFRDALDARAKTGRPVMLSDDQFAKWLESDDTIALNALPVHYDGARRAMSPGNPDSAMSMSLSMPDITAAHP